MRTRSLVIVLVVAAALVLIGLLITSGDGSLRSWLIETVHGGPAPARH